MTDTLREAVKTFDDEELRYIGDLVYSDRSDRKVFLLMAMRDAVKEMLK